MNEYKLVLASNSPRRKEILEKTGFSFDVMPSNVEEIVDSTVPSSVCMSLAKQKALDVASRIKIYNDEHPDLVTPQNILVLGADTIVVFEEEILGKPDSEETAFSMLNKLSGNTHSVYTGVSLAFLSKDGRAGEISFYEKTDVTFYEMSEADIKAYIATGSPMDKAGAYGIQDYSAKFLKKIDGDYYNVVGLPIGRICEELKKLEVKTI